MKATATTRGLILLTGMALGTTAGAITTLSNYVRREIRRRGYPAWEECRCEFKSQPRIFQVWHSTHRRRGETVVAQEWGSYLSQPPQWMRRFLHHSSQILATLNPQGHYVERITLSPQEAHQLAILFSTGTTNEDEIQENAHIVWRREILHTPRYSFGVCTRRLYPAHISQERLAEAQSLPALWDPQNDLPLPTEGTLLDTQIGTRIDYIGWTPSQISYCTARNP